MYAKAGQAGILIAHFVASGAAATGLTVTAKVWEITDANAKSPNDTTGTTATVTEIGGGAYKAPYTMGADGVPIAVFSTTGTADVKSVPASFVHLGTLDTLVTAVGDVHATDLPALKAVVDNIHDTDLPSVKTDTTAIHTAVDDATNGLPAIKSAIPAAAPSAVAVRTEMDSNSSKLANLDAAVSTRLATSGYTAPSATATLAASQPNYAPAKAGDSMVASNMVAAAPAAATVASAVRTELTTELGRVDAAVSTRLATSGYTAPPSVAALATAAMLTDVQTDVDELQTSVAAIPTNPYTGTPPTADAIGTDAATKVWGAGTKAVTSIPAVTGATLSSAYDHAKDDVLTPLAVVDSNVDAILVDTGTTLDAAIAALPTDTDVNAACDTAISDAGIPAAAATAVWGTATKAVTAIPDVQLAATQDHITPYSGTPPTPPSADAIADEVQTRTIARVTLVDTTTTNTDMVAAAPTTAQIEAALLNEGDSSALLQAIADKVSGDWSAGDVSATAVASAVRTNLATELGRIDAAVTTRSTYAGADTSGTTELLTRIPDATPGTAGGLPLKSDLPATAPTPDAIADEVETRTIARVTLVDTTTVNTDMRGTNGAVTSLSGIATATNVADGADEVIAALPAAAPSASDNATAVRSELGTELGRIDAAITTRNATTPPAVAAIRTELDSNSTKLAHLDADVSTRLATSGYTAPPAAAPSAASIAALILSTPVYKIVTNADGSVNAEATVDTSAIADAVVAAIPDVTVDLTPATDAIAALHDFNPATDTVARVTLVDTVTALTGKTGFSGSATNMVAAAPTTAAIRTELATELGRLDVATSTRLATSGYTAPSSVAGLATEANATSNKNAVVGAMPAAAPSAASVAALILATPVHKLATNSDGSVNATASVDTELIASDVVTALEVAGIPTLSVIEGSTVLAMKDDVQITVSAPSVTVNPTVLSTGERAAIAAATDAAVTVSHGFGAYGSATFAAGVIISPATLGLDGNPIGRVMPYGEISVYLSGVVQYKFDADADGDFTYELPYGSVWTLTARRPTLYRDTTVVISTDDSVS